MLSWILQGISNHESLKDVIAFKGGTVLKKVYFEDYRFSEDLDFTLLDTEITNNQIFQWFNEVFEYVREEANIPLNIIENNEHEGGGINFYISYRGSLGGQGSHKRVKVDISRSEKLEFKLDLQPVILGYSDQEEHELLCYSLQEVLVEKMRSVMQRMQPRDFYDIWYLLEIHEMDVEFYLNEFRAKCESKGLDSKLFFEKLELRKPSYKGRWQQSMVAQINDLPDFDRVDREVQRHIKNLNI